MLIACIGGTTLRSEDGSRWPYDAVSKILGGIAICECKDGRSEADGVYTGSCIVSASSKSAGFVICLFPLPVRAGGGVTTDSDE